MFLETGASSILLKHVLKIVRIVNPAVLLLTGRPRKARVTARAPHLVTSVFLVNAFVTLRAVFGVFLEHPDRLLVLLGTFVRVVVFQMTLPAELALAQTAPVVGRDTPPALFAWTRHEKRSSSRCRNRRRGSPLLFERPFFFLKDSKALVSIGGFGFELDDPDLLLDF